MARKTDPSEDEVDRRIRDEIGALLAKPARRTRRSIPPALRNPSGRAALSLWHESAVYSNAPRRHEKWWDALDPRIKNEIKAAIDRFDTIEALIAEWHIKHRGVVVIEGNHLGARLNELREQLPQVSLDEFVSLMNKPTADRTKYAEDFGASVTRILKEYLEIPSHRPKLSRSEADLRDDLWQRKLFAYIFQFSEKCR